MDRPDLKAIRQLILPHYVLDKREPHPGISASGNVNTNEQASIQPLGDGLINQTYLVSLAHTQMVLQRINSHVFPNPKAVVNNAVKISQQLLALQQQGRYPMVVVQPIATRAGEYFVTHPQLGFWRAMTYVAESDAYTVPQSNAQIAAAATAFGQFCAALSTLDSSCINEVIPHFHHLPHRLQQLQAAIESADNERLNRARDWCDFAQSQQILLAELKACLVDLPMRICHYDTKLNNMLFKQSRNEPLAVIDLDTCMPGYLMYDFGDMVRAMCASNKEDMQKFDDIFIKPGAFAALAQAYVAALQGVIVPREVQSLWLGVKLVILELAVRFLTDYLNGDLYFQTEYATHNLDRARNQFTLFKSALNQQQTLQALLPKV
ncbi:aminoglycoside phosphotransferase family protein [Shewanella gelidii]|uniref:Aminoglycoside phosphotransferase n=1 Tax=Shewanella gelidii TaxID=1642821 RepID=A0A917NA97_9GAMM|nr:aminoglycoside phosphotransferase family protein [Shewanella gelidii]MCL1098431.1 aminoglycoside phosphotransferase family protein [Shewanella gelidii]GGI82777.1 aminoglycoside phosphotransferase [Shewanella gelidii]